jgi:hypothetical protein
VIGAVGVLFRRNVDDVQTAEQPHDVEAPGK